MKTMAHPGLHEDPCRRADGRGGTAGAGHGTAIDGAIDER